MVRGGPANRAVRKAKIFALTKGFRGRSKNCYSLAVRAAHRALQYAYRGRRLKRREMRRLWIQRVNYASTEHGINYSRFMYNMVKCNIRLNRKVLSELAIHEPRTFQALAEIAKRRQASGLLSALDTPPQEAGLLSTLDMPPQEAGLQSTLDTPPQAKNEEESSPGPSTDLYATRVVVNEAGRRVMETPV